jgi:hypothetical protein
MSPKEKAQEIFDKFKSSAMEKEYSLIVVDEVINGNFAEGYIHEFWVNVKKEIEKL